MPDRVEERTGYRWYAPEQVQTAVLIRTLRQLSIPVADIQAILAEPDPGRRLAVIDQHWVDVEREVASARRVRDHLSRIPGGWQEMIRGYQIQVRDVAELPVLVRYRYPADHEDGEDDGGDGDREVEVCLPVSGDGDALLPGGRLVWTEASGANALPPRLLTAYGAVSQWAHEQEQKLVDPALEIQLGDGRIRVGWLLAPLTGATS